jgi:RimJ/RimL family protein N-acetyltransferase
MSYLGVLEGRVARLEPLTTGHVGALTRAAHESRDTFGYTFVPDGEDAMRAYVDLALADRDAGLALPYAVRDCRGDRVVGSTRYLDIERWSEAREPTVVEIGSTWLCASAQRTGINTECKYLLLHQAFDEWEVHRVTFKTDARNERSRRAIERIGAQFEGVRRAHMVAADGGIRDSAYYSIIRSEWPQVSQHLLALMAARPLPE